MATTILLSACQTYGTKGIVPIGPNMYMVGRLGNTWTDWSGSAVKERLYKEAAKFCTDKGRVMYPMNSAAHDAQPFGEDASAEIQFKCLLPSDPLAAQR